MSIYASTRKEPADGRRRRFSRCESGGVTVEAALWIPFWLFFLFGLAQTAFIFHGQARMLDTAQSATRAYAIGEIDSTSALETSIKGALATFSSNVTVNTYSSNGVIKTIVTVPAMDFGIGIFKSLEAFNLTVASQAVRET